MRPSAASRQVLSVSACCWSMRSKSGRNPAPPRCGAGGGGASCAAADQPAARHVRTRRAAMRGSRSRIRELYLRGGPRVIEDQPLAEVFDRLDGRTAVERHHRPRSAGRARDLRAEIVAADGGYLDSVFAAIDGFVESLEGHGGSSILRVRFRRRKRKETRRRIHMQPRRENRTSRPQKFFAVSECPQAFHRSSTCFPQG